MSLTPKQSPQTTPTPPTFKVIAPESVEFHPTLRFVNRTRRFSFPIPDLGDQAEPLVFPAASEKAGQAIKAFADGTPEKGVVFYNATDSIWQGVRANGEAVLVINDIDLHTAQRLMEKITFITSDIDELTLGEVKEIIQFAQEDLGIKDIYNGRRSSMESNTQAHESMPVPMGKDNQPRNDFGYRVVNKDDVHRGALITGGFIFDDKRGQRYTDGAVVLTDEMQRWCVALDVFKDNFKKLVDGQEVSLGDLEQEFAV